MTFTRTLLVMSLMILATWRCSACCAQTSRTANETINGNSTGWTARDASSHAGKFNNRAEWSPKFRESDLKMLRRPLSDKKLAMPFPFTVFPALHYEYGDTYGNQQYGGLNVGFVQLPEPFVATGASVNRYLGPKDVPKAKKYHEAVVTDPLMYVVASGKDTLVKRRSESLSRSHPHYFFQGSFTSNHGDIDWVAIRLASGQEIGIINGRILDLSLGNLILVRQFEDGSIRIHQWRDRLKPKPWPQTYLDVKQMLGDKKFKQFFTNKFEWVERDAKEAKTTPLGNTRTWSAKQLSQHADNFNNPEFWWKEILNDDARDLKRPLNNSVAAMPFSWTSFPIPFYLYNDDHYFGLSDGELSLTDELKGSACSINRAAGEEKIPDQRKQADNRMTEPLMYIVVSGDSKIKNIDQRASSRSHPHYFFQGSFESENGQIDWVAIQMQGGTKVGIVNGRILDLSQGNLILIRQEESGFVQIMQHRDRLVPSNANDIEQTVIGMIKEEPFVQFLKSSK